MSYLEHYAQNWGRTLEWAERRFAFFQVVSDLLAMPGVEDVIREWARDRERMQQEKMRLAPIGDAGYAYWQGASNEIGTLVDNLRIELATFRQGRENYDEAQKEPEAE